MISMTAFRTVVISLMLSFVNFAYAQNGTWMKGAEGWIRLTCHGIITPRSVPFIEKKIMIGHIKINSNQPYPSLEKLSNENPQFFKDLTEQCTNRRRAMVDLTNYNPANWLDWGSDWAYTRLEVGLFLNPWLDSVVSKVIRAKVRSSAVAAASHLLFTAI
jgi:hypothetical protein